MSTYVITVPCFAQMLRSLKGLLSKARRMPASWAMTRETC